MNGFEQLIKAKRIAATLRRKLAQHGDRDIRRSTELLDEMLLKLVKANKERAGDGAG